ncbi:putative HTH-type transcriptional regulator YusO [Pirellula sp. SH-Sr6A]|uniref:MarR family winged helix-turn-helix transcriptional regulator n=1 Tax=Pirellula sp. SH-Sr6A TaxID=1632865 RepID=UPI00078C46C9|nr:MarR family winged helix-turn-helix transcriptional regulator [Pirellula sp. SH-Sr6A]AMV31494.1 putative HTH-type transcriptional regulator YusO [Pirellula sp. SH-Sr6A]
MTPKKRPSELNDHLGYWLRYVSSHVSHAFAVKVEEQGVTVAEWVLLRVLFDVGEAKPSQIAESIGMTRGAVSKLAERLCQKKLLVRELSDDDRRSQTIGLTSAGKRLVPILAKLADENDRHFFGHLRADERRILVSTLEGIVRKNGWKDLPIE